jgi:membrane-anchored protein YejM (alkaline phosphatase superfamily)
MASKGYADIATYNFKLYDLLHDLGYRTYFVLSGDHTFFYSECRAALGNDMDLFFDGFSSHQYPVSDDRLVLDGLDQVPDYAGAPAFFYLFLSAPHPVGVRDPQYERYRPARLDTRGMVAVWTGVRNLEAMINRYDNSVLQADAALEQIFAKLDRKGYLADAVAVILADHGLGLGERGNYSHTIYLYQEDINIPLLIYDDTNTVYANLEFATQTDVAPTIVDRLGLPIPACWQGHSLLRDNTRQFSFHTTTRPSEVWRAVIYRTDDKLYKYLEFRKAGLPPEREELYELVADPREAQNLIARADNGLIRLVKEKLAAAFKVPNN